MCDASGYTGGISPFSQCFPALVGQDGQLLSANVVLATPAEGTYVPTQEFHDAFVNFKMGSGNAAILSAQWLGCWQGTTSNVTGNGLQYQGPACCASFTNCPSTCGMPTVGTGSGTPSNPGSTTPTPPATDLTTTEYIMIGAAVGLTLVYFLYGRA